MILLIEESREDFALKFVNNKLIRRFWNVIAAYIKVNSYIDILTEYFSSNYKEKVITHRKISNNKLQ